MVNVALVVAPTGTVVVPAAPIVPPVQVNEDDTVRSPLWVPPDNVKRATVFGWAVPVMLNVPPRC